MVKLKEYKGFVPPRRLFAFHCPGCGYDHCFYTGFPKDEHSSWEWNGSMNSPTIRPSMGVFMKEPSNRCHFFLTDGEIHFLDDCFHHLKGQTVAMLDWN